ncbi:MAG: hypothetical protein KF905_03250 [Flavobacteriales bacterium]|nr:hypothetical protein [Flavobacteriales bacterium]
MKRALRLLRNTLLILTGLFTLLFGMVCYILYAHEQEIADELIAVFNEGQAGKLSYSGVELSPFRAFPYISIDIKDLRFDGDKHTENDHAIYAFHDVYVGFNMFDLLRGKYVIKNLLLSEGHLYLEKYADGTYNITRAKARDEEDEAGGSTHLDLKHVELRNITLHEVNYAGEGNQLYLDIQRADAYLSSIDEVMRMGLDSELFLYYYTSGKNTWFRELPFGLDLDMVIDGGLVNILPSKLTVEAGALDVEGSIDLDNDLMTDLKLSGRKKNFDVFISFAPPEVLEKLKEFRNEGDIFFEGIVQGPIDVRSPLIDLRLGCERTMFEHRSLGKALRDVAFSGHFRTGDDGGLEGAFLEMENLYGEPERGMLRGTMRVDNFLDPRITMDFHANFQLEHLKAFYDVEDIEEGSGLVTIDITLNEYIGPDSVLHFATKMTDGVTSNITFTDVRVKLAKLEKPIEQLNGKILLDGDDLRSEGLKVRVGQSDLAIDFATSNVSALFHHTNAPVDVTLHGESKRLHMAELLALNGKPVDEPWARDTVFDLKFDLDLHTTVDALDNSRYVPATTLNFRHLEFRTAKYPHPVGDISGKIAVDDERLKVQDFGITIGRNKLHASVELENLGALLDSARQETVRHTLSVKSPYFNAKELLVYDGKAFVHDSIEEEVLRDLVFRGSGSMQSNTFSDHGFISETHIDHLSLRFNDLPPLRNVDGYITTDTSGCITLKGLQLAMGRSDLKADLYLRHFLDDDVAHKIIEGSVRAKNLDFDEIGGWSPAKQEARESHAEAFNLFALKFPDMALQADIGRIKHHRTLLEDLHGKVRTTKDHLAHIDTLHFRAAGGRVAMRGTFNGSRPDSITLKGDMRVDGVDLDQVMFKLDNFGQDFVVHENLHGQVSGTIRLDAHLHPDLVPDLAHTTAVADLTVVNGRLARFGPLHAMADFMGDKDLDNIRFGELSNTFTFRDGALHIPEMKITSTLGYMHLSGRQSLDLDMDYTMRIPLSLVKQASWNAMKSKLRGSGRNKEDEEELERADAKIISGQKGPIKGYLTMNVTGNPDDYKVRLGRSREKR